MTREEIKNKALELSKIYKILALEFATGVGKSKVALDICNSTLTKDTKILIVVAELAHIQNWEDEFLKWDYAEMWDDNVTIVTYASLRKHKHHKYDFIILDEAHHIGSDLRLDVIENIKFKKLLLLSATLDSSLINQLSSIFNEKIRSCVVTLQQAIDWGILKKPSIHLIPLTLERVKETELIIEEWGKEKNRVTYKCDFKDRWEFIKNRKKYPNTRLEIKCTQQEKYYYLTRQFEYYKTAFFRSKSEALKNKWLLTGSQRKIYLGELKTEVARKLIKDKLKNKRHICFCASINQADYLNRNNSIHSMKTNSLDIINDFNRKKINSLYAVGMLQEGQNLAEVDAGIIVQLDNVERSFIQKFGRTLRADNPELYILYYKDTRDEEYLNKNVLNEIDSEYISVLEI